MAVAQVHRLLADNLVPGSLRSSPADCAKFVDFVLDNLKFLNSASSGTQLQKSYGNSHILELYAVITCLRSCTRNGAMDFYGGSPTSAGAPDITTEYAC